MRFGQHPGVRHDPRQGTLIKAAERVRLQVLVEVQVSELRHFVVRSHPTQRERCVEERLQHRHALCAGALVHGRVQPFGTHRGWHVERAAHRFDEALHIVFDAVTDDADRLVAGCHRGDRRDQ